MNRVFAPLLCFCSITLFGPSPAAAVTISPVTIAWSPVGNPGNAPDPATGLGSVGYAYKISTYDVTNNQYVAFLNAKDPTGANTLGLYNFEMSNVVNDHGGINAFNGTAYTVVPGHGNLPANHITWYDAIRFANWLQNGQGNGDTETGAYTLLGGTPTPSDAASITRNAGAIVSIPNENEWYKAAYYDPRTTAQGGPPSDSHYWLYPTSNNAAPADVGPPGGSNSANYDHFAGTLTDVGAYTTTTSPCGAFDMGGNVDQWVETLTGNDTRGARGGAFSNVAGNLQSTFGDSSFIASNLDNFMGLRLASLPEPSTGVLAVLACCAIWWRRKRFK
jgi:sulfatase modifying factor 1